MGYRHNQVLINFDVREPYSFSVPLVTFRCRGTWFSRNLFGERFFPAFAFHYAVCTPVCELLPYFDDVDITYTVVSSMASMPEVTKYLLSLLPQPRALLCAALGRCPRSPRSYPANHYPPLKLRKTAGVLFRSVRLLQ